MEHKRGDASIVIVQQGFGAGGLFLAFLGGAVAGAAAALLTAPQSGAESRALLKSLASRPGVLIGRVPEAVAGAAEAFTDALKDSSPASHASRKHV